jgi:OOP family OmpA-OmpF porin
VKLLAILFLTLPLPLWAAQLSLPTGATLTFERSKENARYPLPVGRFTSAIRPVRMISGTVETRVWKIARTFSESWEVLRPIQERLTTDGYEVLFACETEDCGGFAYRFGTEIVPPPKMRVALGDFAQVSLKKEGGLQTRWVSLLVSRLPDAVYVQEISILSTNAPSETDTAPELRPIANSLLENGRAVLEGLEFSAGQGGIAGDPAASIKDLADLMKENPALSIAIVGHSDNVGSLEANRTLSRQRALAVLEQLATIHGIERERMSAEGVGFLAPRRSNATETGQAMNRRVEVILLN